MLLPPRSDTTPVEKVAPLSDKSMGALATAYAALLKQYGTIGVRFNTLGEFYDCVRKQINDHKTAESCL